MCSDESPNFTPRHQAEKYPAFEERLSAKNNLQIVELDNITFEKKELTIFPDEDGRFGFNVKGGLGTGRPIYISKIVPDAPADKYVAIFGYM